MVPQKKCRIAGSLPMLTVTETSGEVKLIEAQQHIHLLGGNIQNNMSWKAHLIDGEKAVIPTLRRRLGSLKHIASQLPRKSRQTLANGLISSRIHYLVQVWGGAHNKFLNKMQTILNKLARFVCNANRRTSTRSLMEQCKWMYIRESIDYFSLISMWNYKWRGIPHHFSFKIELGPNDTLVMAPARILTLYRSHRWRSTETWNLLSREIRLIPSLPRFKTAVKKWIMQKRSRQPD